MLAVMSSSASRPLGALAVLVQLHEKYGMAFMIYYFWGTVGGVGVGVGAGLAKTIGAAEITPFPS